MKIHLFGASGAGVSTLGSYIATRYGFPLIDADDIYWERTPVPFEVARPFELRQQELQKAVAGKPDWVISGSMMRWGDILIPDLDCAVFVEATDEERLARLKLREEQRYGAGLKTRRDLREKSEKFLHWAMRYDHGDMEGRSRKRHEEWILSLSCPLYRVHNGDLAAAKIELDRIVAAETERLSKRPG